MLERGARFDEFVAGGDHHDARSWVHHRAAMTCGGEDRDLTRAEVLPSSQHLFTGVHVFAGPADEHSRFRTAGDRHNVGSAVGAFDRNDRVCTIGQRRTGHDADRGAGTHALGGAIPRGHIVDDPQLHRGRLTRTGDIGGEHRIAIHRRVVERWQRPQGFDIGGEHAPMCFEQRQVDRLERRDGRQPDCLLLLDGAKHQVSPPLSRYSTSHSRRGGPRSSRSSARRITACRYESRSPVS